MANICRALTLTSILLTLSSIALSDGLTPETEPPTEITDLNIVEADPHFEFHDENTESDSSLGSLKPRKLKELIEPEDLKKLRKLIGDDAFLKDEELQDITRKHEEVDPEWEPIVSELTIMGYKVKKCCLRVIRSTRYSAEDACRALGRKIWMVESNRPEITEKPYRYQGTCAVFKVKQNDKTTAYSCKARATAKCIISEK